jgi:hypothetical protein
MIAIAFLFVRMVCDCFKRDGGLTLNFWFCVIN